MNILRQFSENIKRQQLFSSGDKLLLAVSGGLDSVVLCELCRQAGFDFIIAHCNFQLRGEESERDEQFTRSLARKYETEILVKKFDTTNYAAEKKLSIQVAARELRYAWFNHLIEMEKTAVYLLTAHHADDNAETIAMNFFRGTGLHGLTGIPARSGHIRRPLLNFSRETLQEFARVESLEFVEDSSNLSTKYTRNLFRHEIFPLIEKVYPQVKENLQDNIRRFSAIEELYRHMTGELKKKLCRKKGDEIHIPIRQLLSFHNKALVFEIITEYGFTEKQVDELLKLAESDSGSFIQSPDGAYRVIRHRHWFIISSGRSPEAATIIIEEKKHRVDFPGGFLLMESSVAGKSILKTAPHIAQLDADRIEFPLLLRKWKAGDYFYPLGMRKKKKLSRFFIDQKLSRTEKENQWVLEMNQKIIWVTGHRIDDRFKVTAATRDILEITFHKA